jgi:hypothetical protein
MYFLRRTFVNVKGEFTVNLEIYKQFAKEVLNCNLEKLNKVNLEHLRM